MGYKTFVINNKGKGVINDLPPESLEEVGSGLSTFTSDDSKANKNASNISLLDAFEWRQALDLYNKSQVDNKFINKSEESLTYIQQPTLVGNVLTLKYLGENGTVQEQTVDLSNLATINVKIEGADYNASTNIITLTDSTGATFNINLSEFSILTSTDANGITTLTQEGVAKLVVSKVGQTGSYNDLLDKPTIPAPVDISGKEDKSNKQNNLTPDGTGVKYPTVDAVNAKNTLQDSAIIAETATRSGVENLMHHFWNSSTGKWVSSGLKHVAGVINQLEYNGRLKIAALILPPNTNPNVANRLWSDGTYVYYDNGLAIPKKLAYTTEIFEHQVRGKRVELSGVGGTTLNIDLNAGSFFAVTNTGTGNVQMEFTNMIGADESTVINIVVTGNLFTLPAGLIGDSYNDIPNVAKKRKYIFTIEKGGLSPIISYNLINV